VGEDGTLRRSRRTRGVDDRGGILWIHLDRIPSSLWHRPTSPRRNGTSPISCGWNRARSWPLWMSWSHVSSWSGWRIRETAGQTSGRYTRRPESRAGGNLGCSKGGGRAEQSVHSERARAAHGPPEGAGVSLL